MRKLLLVGATAALGATACSPELGSEPPADVVVAQFDPTGSPAVVPTPNDLAIDSKTGLVAAPIDPTSSAAYQEFTRDYLNSLNGFPTATPATAKIVDLDPATVNAQSVRIIDLLAGTPIATPEVKPTVVYDAVGGQLVIKPPASGWPKGGKYAVALIGGKDGLKGTNGRPVVGSATWAFARSAKPLVTCEDLTASDCQTTTEIIPSQKTDPVERLADQTHSALQLEQLRRAYKPMLDALDKGGVKRDDVALLWTFTIVNQPEFTFNPDPRAPIIPFPNDLLRVKDATTGQYHLGLPVPALAQDGSNADVVALYKGLNTLDGFSTTAPIVSENGDATGALETGAILDPNTLSAGAAFLKLGDPTKGTAPNVKACINDCANPAAATTAPQQLMFAPLTPLDEQTQYAAVLTTDLKDIRGRRVMAPAAFALLRLANPLVDASGKSTLPVVDDATANALEPVRQGFKPLFDGLDKNAHIPRSKIALGWAFTTQSTTSVLQALHGLPTQYGQKGLPDVPVYIKDVTSKYAAVPGLAGVGTVFKVFEGSAAFPLALTGTAGTLNPTAPVFQRIPFILTTPVDTSKGTNFPVVVFGHGITGNRTNMLGIAGTLASGYKATIAIDEPLHGERSSCVGSAAALGAQDDNAACTSTSVCDESPTSPTFGRCIAKPTTTRNTCVPTDLYAADQGCFNAGQGLCLPTSATTGVCEGGDFARDPNSKQPLVNGNILNLANFFATRDNFRHAVIDMAQLVRVISSSGATGIDAQLKAANADADLSLDETKIDYLGQSLGGILGSLTVAATPEIHRAVLNVPGGDPVGILLNSQNDRFVAARNGLFTKLASQGMGPGTPGFNTFIGIAYMIMDPADPSNAAYALRNSAQAPADRQIFVQYIQGDDVVPNPQTAKLLAAANRNAAKTVAATQFTIANQSTLPVANRHGFLLSVPAGAEAIRSAAQTQVLDFFATGTVPAATTPF